MTVLRQWRELRSEQVRPTLTAKETEVLRAIADGATTKSMARSMGVSARTVESHRARIYAKLGARGHVQAVALGLELGLLADDGSQTG
nr:helix-turn-helix transcriptional regulator [Nocardioides flavescens]